MGKDMKMEKIEACLWLNIQVPALTLATYSIHGNAIKNGDVERL